MTYVGIDERKRENILRLLCTTTKDGENRFVYFILTPRHPDYSKAREWMTKNPYKQGDGFRMVFSKRGNRSILLTDTQMSDMTYNKLFAISVAVENLILKATLLADAVGSKTRNRF